MHIFRSPFSKAIIKSISIEVAKKTEGLIKIISAEINLNKFQI